MNRVGIYGCKFEFKGGRIMHYSVVYKFVKIEEMNNTSINSMFLLLSKLF